MFLARLSGNNVRLSELTMQDANAFLASNIVLAGGDNITNLLQDKNVVYWSVHVKTTNQHLGIIGITLNLKPNQIFFRFNDTSDLPLVYIEESLSLLVEYLVYKKLHGNYVTTLKPNHTNKTLMQKLGFEMVDKQSWQLIVS